MCRATLKGNNWIVYISVQLSSTRSGRAYLKEKNAYVILRELHKWEKVEDNLSTLMDLIDILIADEPQEGMEDLHKVEIPLDIAKKFEENPQGYQNMTKWVGDTSGQTIIVLKMC